jgi:hypothetical protein
MRFLRVATAAVVNAVTCMTGTALASSNYPPSPSATTVVRGAGSGAGSTAFTGGDVSVIGVALAVLAALGLIALVAARFWPERNGGSHFRV